MYVASQEWLAKKILWYGISVGDKEQLEMGAFDRRKMLKVCVCTLLMWKNWKKMLDESFAWFNIVWQPSVVRELC